MIVFCVQGPMVNKMKRKRDATQGACLCTPQGADFLKNSPWHYMYPMKNGSVGKQACHLPPQKTQNCNITNAFRVHYREEKKTSVEFSLRIIYSKNSYFN